MKGLVAVIICVFLFQEVPPKYWETFNDQEKEAVLNNANVPDLIKSLFYTPVSLTDDSTTECILEILSTPQQDWRCRAFFFYMFNNYFLKSDGALAEMVAPYCYKVFVSNPEYVLAYINANSDLLNWYASGVGNELAFIELGVSEFPQMDYPTFEKQLLLKNGGVDCSRFLELVKQYMMCILEQ